MVLDARFSAKHLGGVSRLIPVRPSTWCICNQLFTLACFFIPVGGSYWVNTAGYARICMHSKKFS